MKRRPQPSPYDGALVFTAGAGWHVQPLPADAPTLDELVEWADERERPQLTLAGFHVLDELLDEPVDLWPATA